MALFGAKKNKSNKEGSPKDSSAKKITGPAPVAGTAELVVSKRSAEGVVLHPRITEKATAVVEDNNAYVFDVEPSATKNEIFRAIQNLYKVSPVKIRTSKVAKKPTTIKGKRAWKPGGKKAYVYLKDGDSIEFV